MSQITKAEAREIIEDFADEIKRSVHKGAGPSKAIIFSTIY